MLVAVTAIGGSVATYASTLINPGSKTAPAWYRYVSGDPESPTSYTATDAQPADCGGGDITCAVLAEPNSLNPEQPDLSIEHTTVFKL